MQGRTFSLVALMIGAFAGPAASGADFGLDWATIGDPGNRPTLAEETPYDPDLSAGGVDYTYRMTRTEITVGQWFAFVNAYAPYVDVPNDTGFTGNWIFQIGSHDDGTPRYTIFGDNTEQYPTKMSWRYAARYANWLHNGKAMNREAFEQGAYDTSTFGENPDGTLTDQHQHSPGARFWIPTQDEWIKAAHWDPDKEGPGEGGYWLFPDSSDTPLVPGVPGEGETNAGVSFPFVDLPVGSYPEVQSPWGLLDLSGGEDEWLETQRSPGYPTRYIEGTPSGGTLIEYLDRIDFHTQGAPFASSAGLRLASVVPSPAGSVVIITGCYLCLLGRNRK